jgi:nucleotide-binding universal stress UspA family protein
MPACKAISLPASASAASTDEFAPFARASSFIVTFRWPGVSYALGKTAHGSHQLEVAMFKTVLVAADDSITASRAVTTAVELVAALGGKLHVMTAYHPGSIKADKLPDEFMDRITDPADLLLLKLRDSVTKAGLEAEYHPAAGDAAEAIVRVADQVGADLIVVGNRGMKGVRRVLGSVPNSVAHKANCSVLIVDTVGDD